MRAPSEAAPVDPGVLAPQFPVLDALRALGALAVLTTHVAFYSGDAYRHGTWGDLLSRLDVGVAIFFVLSGFLLARPWLARAAVGRDRPAAGHYLWKRMLRIAPVYLLAVVLAMVLLRSNHDLGVRDWAVTLLMLNTFVDPLPPAGLSQMWSLGVEVTFYLALPLLMLAATGRRRWSPARVCAVLLAMVMVSVWWHLAGAGAAEPLTDGPALQWLPAYLTWFAVGIGLALAHVLLSTGRAGRLVKVLLGLGRQPGVCWSLAAAALLVATTPVAGPTQLLPSTPAESLTKHLLYAAVGGLLVLSGVAAGPGTRFHTVLGAVPARHLGLISYSLFSLHLLLIDALAPALGWELFGGNGVRLWALTVVVSIVCADLTYRFIERPAMRLKSRFPLRGRPTPASRTATGTTER